jgi:hypothetical protein
LGNVTTEAEDAVVNNIGDILVDLANNAGKLLIEAKSWKPSTLNNIQGVKFFNQFKAYLANINMQSTENLIYTFDKRKLLTEFGTDPGRFPDAAAAQNAIRQEFQGMLSDGGKAQEVFDANPAFFQGNNIIDAPQLQSIATDGNLINHPVLDFISVN